MDLLVRVLVGLVVAVVLVWLLPFALDWLIALVAFALIVFAWDGSTPRRRL